MTVVCKVNCPYNDRGFCVRGLTAIDENGMCEMWWREGQRRVNSEMEQGAPLYREDLVILNEQKAEDVEDGTAVEEDCGPDGEGITDSSGESTAE